MHEERPLEQILHSNSQSDVIDNSIAHSLYLTMHRAILKGATAAENGEYVKQSDLDGLVKDYEKIVKGLSIGNNALKYVIPELMSDKGFRFQFRRDIKKASDIGRNAYVRSQEKKPKAWIGKLFGVTLFAAVVVGVGDIAYNKILNDFRKESASVEARIDSRLDIKERQIREEIEQRAQALLAEAETRYQSEKVLLLEEVEARLKEEMAPITQGAEETAQIARYIERVMDEMAPRMGINPDDFKKEE